MAKIGILTFHGSHNYGSVLQAYALSKQLEVIGNHQVEIINLRNSRQRKAYKIFQFTSGFRGVARTIFAALIYRQLKTRFNKYESFIQNVLPITKKEFQSGVQLAQEDFDYDFYICGSDQIWNPICQEFETAYYLDFLKNNKPKIAYAPSLGRTEFDEYTLKLIARLLQNINSIAVREKQGAQLLRTLTPKKVDIVCDPVILLDKKYWDEITIEPKIKKPYMLAYFLENNHGNRSLLNFFKQQTGLEVVILNEYMRDYLKPYHHAFDTGPGEFLGLFKHASLVYTNSFHGTAFSTIFNRPFFTAVSRNKAADNNNDSRKTDYLERIGLSQRILKEIPNLDTILTIDYREPNKRIEEFRQHSLAYLNNALSCCDKTNGGEMFAKDNNYRSRI
ncbi:hypothetical protein SPSIL_010480 [Sporomusa silvacetica DSM 10669]|uniref:Polysaccharide pyruvyl transferase domain-containing protein n=1 Tax=Sporomusa silvacetica DSM 10669 TaxID=1123289 RepID=A0ABZ3IGX3_9FIRM|nr:polysaccharide pyruvyl transferase family protein [Sporomusa silvacetica]OZC21438.1 polysaccharide pyruvyl transferase [Sporomusa silvacetica DSM 10669]